MLEQLDDLGFMVERPSRKACYQCYQCFYQYCCAVTPKILFICLIINSVVCTLLGFYLGRQSVALSFGPDISRSVETFLLNKTFTEAPSPSSNLAWRELIPAGRGFIAVEDDEQPVSNPDGREETDPSRIRSIAVFHQLHCLNQLRVGYYATHPESSISSSSSSSRNSDDHSPNHPRRAVPEHHHDPAHMKHCFDYLRQALMCASDMTLEPMGEDGKGTNGWGVKHQCRDFHMVFAWAERYRAGEDGGIL